MTGGEALESVTQESGVVSPAAVAPTEVLQRKYTVLEALSATGLRAIRYAKEIDQIAFVQANDLSPSAAESIRMNVKLNKLDGPIESPELGRVRVSEGDACALMYQHRTSSRFHVVDLDPYGTAAPFIDGAVQCVADGGMLCVTCTDMAVLAGCNYPEKCFTNYGGLPVKSDFTHEAALRLVLGSISTAAARYGRAIEPLLSLSIDFYVRLFIRVRESPVQTKLTLRSVSLFKSPLPALTLAK